MAAIAAFAASPQGRMYAAVCDRWGVDPGAAMSDDVSAYALRAALMVQTAPDVEDISSTEPDGWEAAGAANERAWRAGARAAQ